MIGVYYAPKIVPCECGSTDVFWHGPAHGRRIYCCDACWVRAAGEPPQVDNVGRYRERSLPVAGDPGRGDA
jgi:hypothetical protein